MNKQIKKLIFTTKRQKAVVSSFCLFLWNIISNYRFATFVSFYSILKFFLPLLCRLLCWSIFTHRCIKQIFVVLVSQYFIVNFYCFFFSHKTFLYFLLHNISLHFRFSQITFHTHFNSLSFYFFGTYFTWFTFKICASSPLLLLFYFRYFIFYTFYRAFS